LLVPIENTAIPLRNGPIGATFSDRIGFAESEKALERSCSPEEIHDVLHQLAGSLASLADKTS
jgi:hypothetical protein